MMNHSATDLPKNSTPLGLDITFPLSAIGKLQEGYVSQNQDEKWSVYYRNPWFEVWRPSNETGLYCYAVRLEQVNAEQMQVVESWAGASILEFLGSDFKTHRDILTWLFDAISGYARGRFSTDLVGGFRTPDNVSFSGSVRTLAEVEQVADVLKAQVAKRNFEMTTHGNEGELGSNSNNVLTPAPTVHPR